LKASNKSSSSKHEKTAQMPTLHGCIYGMADVFSDKALFAASDHYRIHLLARLSPKTENKATTFGFKGKKNIFR